MTTLQGLALFIVLTTLAGVAFGRLPGLKLERAGIATLGASALVAAGVISVHDAWALIDGEVITLLFALMVVNAALTHAGFFRLLTQTTVAGARHPLALLTLLCLASGVLSALFLNDTVVLMLTPLVIGVCRELRLEPVPFLVALAASANVGSVATITGNPQNLIVGVQGGFSYLGFAAALTPVALLGLGVVIGVVALAHPKLFSRPLEAPPSERAPPSPVQRQRLLRCGLVVLGMLTAFILGMPVAKAALLAAAALLLVGGVPSETLLAEIDGQLLLLFAGLFITVGALDTSGLSAQLFSAVRPLLEQNLAALAAFTALLSNLLSNVPAVLLLAPHISGLPEPRTSWLLVAMASTLAGNLTLVGSVANLIVAERARAQGVTLSFWAYVRLGLPITLLTLALGTLWLARTGS